MFSYLTEHDKIENSAPTKLGYFTHNIYDGFPPLMEDGRTITATHQPEAVLNNYLLKETGIHSNWEYRRYLTNNALDIIKQNRISSMNDVGYIKRYEDMTTNFTTPQTYQSYVDNKPSRGSQNSDLKSLYITREQLNARMVAPEMTQYELLKMVQK